MAELKEKRHEGKPGPYCGRCPYREQPMVPGYGPAGARYMLLGASPGKVDARQGRCFTGITGRRLTKQLGYAKIFLKDCWVGNVVRCYVPPKGMKPRKPTPTSIRCCRPLLEEELSECQPSIVITLGTVAFGAFYEGDLKAYHGARIQTDSYELIPMYKPDAHDDNPDILRVSYQDYRGMAERQVLEPVSGEYAVGKFRQPGNDRYAVDTETTGLDLRSKLLGMAVSEDVGLGVYVPDHEVPRNLIWSGHATMQNAKYDLGILESNGVTPAETGWEDVDDTMILAYCMNKKPLGLKSLAIQELHLEQQRFSDVADGKSLVGVDPELVAQYSCADADLTLRLWDKLWAEASLRERKLYQDIEKPLPPLLAAMQLRGVHVDLSYFEKQAAFLNGRLGQTARRIREMDGCGALMPEVLSSPTRLASFLSALLKVRVGSTERPALERLQKRHPVIELIMAWRTDYKLKTSFVDSILNLQRAGLVFPQFNQTGTTTGRMSCDHPNLQQLPQRDDKAIRLGFPAPEGWLVCSIDNSQIDLRSLAYLSQDEELLRVYREDLDMHDETVRGILKNSKLSAKLKRLVAKRANFLVIFGGGAAALAQKTGISEPQAHAFMDGYWELHPGVELYIKATHKYLQDNGYVETAYGRRRYIPKVFTRERGAALREGQNMPIQGTSADILKLQTKAVAVANTGALMFGQIHDEIDFYVPEDNWKERVRELVKAMVSVDAPFDLKVEAEVGPNLGAVEKVVY